jgi:hypothetical protein
MHFNIWVVVLITFMGGDLALQEKLSKPHSANHCRALFRMCSCLDDWYPCNLEQCLITWNLVGTVLELFPLKWPVSISAKYF